MKLKITDEKLYELCIENIQFYFDAKRSEVLEKYRFERVFYKRGFRAAEQVHQATADKLLQIAEMQMDALNEVNTDNFVYDDYCTDIGERVDAAITKSDKILKELND